MKTLKVGLHVICKPPHRHSSEGRNPCFVLAMDSLRSPPPGRPSDVLRASRSARP